MSKFQLDQVKQEASQTEALLDVAGRAALSGKRVAYISGEEAVEQIRGTAVNQVKDAELCLVTGGPSNIPVSGLILRR